MKAKKLLMVLLAFCFVFSLCVISASAIDYTGYWEYDSGNYYWNENGNRLTSQWIEKDGYKYYVGSDGARYDGGVYTIDGYLYGFNYNGQLYYNTSFDFYNSSTGTYEYYRAKGMDEGGKLYQSEWYDSGYSKYYYLSSGAVARGLLTIDGQQYYFDPYGYLCSSGCYSFYENNVDRFVIVNENGIAIEIKNNEWATVDGERYYVQNNEFCYNNTYTIDGKLYGFRWDNTLYVDEYFSLYDNDLERSIYYRAKGEEFNGELAQNEWVFLEYSYGDGGDWYYYGEGGKAPYGLTILDGKKYCFNYSGQMLKDTEYVYTDDNDVTHYVVIDKDANATEIKNNEWSYVDGNWYYVQNGTLCSGGVYTIGGKLYGFDHDGQMYYDTTFDFYDSTLERWVYYYAQGDSFDGELAQNKWVFVEDYYGEDGYWYYYGEGGKAPYGPKTIDGQLYCFFSNGQMATDCSFTYNDNGKDRFFIADKKGNAIEPKNNQWVNVDDNWYYVQNGALCNGGIYTIGGKLYGFNYDGQMYYDEMFDFYNPTLRKWDYYYAQGGNFDGELAQNKWILRYGNDWYYYGKNGVAASGLTVVDGTQYYFSSNGYMNTQGSYQSYDYSGDTPVVHFYVVDNSGAAVEIYNNEWAYNGGSWYYVQDNKLCQNGVYNIGGKLYGFNYSGQMYYDTSFEIYDSTIGRWVYYYAQGKGFDGVLAQDKWIYRNGLNWYYYNENGQAYSNEIAKVGDKYYYFGYDGYAYSDTIINDEQTEKYYYVTPIDKNGNGGNICTEKNVWKATNGRWVYLSNDSSLHVGPLNEYFMTPYMVFAKYYAAEDGYFYLVNADGTSKKLSYTGFLNYGEGHVYLNNGKYVKNDWVNINSKWYYFDDAGIMYSNSKCNINGKYYFFDQNGVMASNGWIQSGNSWYYATSGGELICEDWKYIDGAWYYFSYSGYMCEDTFAEIDGQYYFFKENGAMASNEWAKDSVGRWYWANKDGTLSVGKTSDGYLFNSSGILVVDTTYEFNGVWYKTNKDGKINYTFNKTGWHYVDGNWYYAMSYDDDSSITLAQYYGEFIDNAYYSFDYDGKMKTNFLANGNYYHGNDGKAVSGWVKVNGDWYYGDPETFELHRYCVSLIDGKNYAFDNSSKLLTNTTAIINNKTVTTNANGEVIKNVVANGWAYDSDDSYGYGEVLYYNNGLPYTGWVGNYYIENGYMVNNTTTHIDNKIYYFDEKGLCLTPGWHELSKNYWVYAKADRSLVYNDWLNDGGTWYYFNDVGMVYNTALKIDGKLHFFNKDGVWTGESNSAVADGWKKIGNDWYFYMAGTPVSFEMLLIDGEYYFFNNSGKMVSNGFYYANGYYYYFSANGERMNYVGWQKINGKWVHFDNYSRVSNRVIENGKEYYIVRERVESNGATKYNAYMAASCYRVVNGTLCYYNADGVLTSKYTTNGWKKIGTDWYYIMNGKVVTSDMIEIDGEEYMFDGSGKLYTDTVISWDSFKYYDKNGQAVTEPGWHKTGDGKWVYVRNDGSLAAFGIFLIDGVEYAFDGGYWVG